MTIKSSGEISFSELQAEFGGEPPIALGEYYKGGAYATKLPSWNGNIPTSGEVRVGAFYGTQKFYPGSYLTGSTGLVSYTLPSYVETVYFSAIGGGAGAGTVVDGGRNDDYGSSGGGSSGQIVRDFPIAVRPGSTVTFRCGNGGNQGDGSRGNPRNGYPGGATEMWYTTPGGGGGYVNALGGNPGAGGEGGDGNNYAGGSYPRGNSYVPSGYISGYDGQNRNDSMCGGYGLKQDFVTLVRVVGIYTGGGNAYYPQLDAFNLGSGVNFVYGGGGGGHYQGYIREDNGNHPAWGGKGSQGLVRIVWKEV